VATVEHLMSAFAGLGRYATSISLVGSSDHGRERRPFVFHPVRGIGSSRAKRFFRIKSTVEVTGRRQVARFEPFEGSNFRFRSSSTTPLSSARRRRPRRLADTSTSRKSPSAHFGFIQDVEALRDSGLALAGVSKTQSWWTSTAC